MSNVRPDHSIIRRPTWPSANTALRRVHERTKGETQPPRLLLGRCAPWFTWALSSDISPGPVFTGQIDFYCFIAVVSRYVPWRTCNLDVRSSLYYGGRGGEQHSRRDFFLTMDSARRNGRFETGRRISCRELTTLSTQFFFPPPLFFFSLFPFFLPFLSFSTYSLYPFIRFIHRALWFRGNGDV